MTPEEQVREMLLEARAARQAIRHALQFLEDPTHKGDGHLPECITACREVLKTDGKWEKMEDAVHSHYFGCIVKTTTAI